jgi:predicted nucleic acid-binding Zn ribbon protein
MGGYVQKSQNVGTDANVVFETIPVSFALKSSEGESLEGDAKFYAGGWKTFGDGKTPEIMELLPASYTFGVTYMGGYMQKSQNVAENADVVFQTVPVSFKLLSSVGLPLKGDASFYAGGWKTFGDGQTFERMELLPVNYTFKVSYLGASMQKTQNVAENSKVVFHTKLVKVNLYAKTKVLGRTVNIPVLGPIGGEVSFYAGGWKDMGKTMVFKEMLPTSYTFAVSFMGERQQLVQDISSDSSVDFYTTADKLKEAIKQALN